MCNSCTSHYKLLIFQCLGVVKEKTYPVLLHYISRCKVTMLLCWETQYLQSLVLWPGVSCSALRCQKCKQLTSNSNSSFISKQILPVIAVNLAAFSSSIALGFSSILLPQIVCSPHKTEIWDFISKVFDPHTNGTSEFSLTEEEGSWIGC